MLDPCKQCGRPAWRSADGMGGGLMPCDETHCLHLGTRSCRIAAEGRRAGMHEALEIITANVDIHDEAMECINAEIAKRCKDG